MANLEKNRVLVIFFVFRILVIILSIIYLPALIIGILSCLITRPAVLYLRVQRQHTPTMIAINTVVPIITVITIAAEDESDLISIQL